MDDSEFDRLAGAMLEQARKRLGDVGQFYPFGAAITQAGQLVLVNYTPPRQQASVHEFLEMIERDLRQGAREGKYVAGGICLLAQAHVPPDRRISDAVCVQLHGAGRESISVFLPYTRQQRQIRLGELFRTPGPPSLFPAADASDAPDGADKAV